MFGLTNKGSPNDAHQRREQAHDVVKRVAMEQKKYFYISYMSYLWHNPIMRSRHMMNLSSMVEILCFSASLHRSKAVFRSRSRLGFPIGFGVQSVEFWRHMAVNKMATLDSSTNQSIVCSIVLSAGGPLQRTLKERSIGVLVKEQIRWR